MASRATGTQPQASSGNRKRRKNKPVVTETDRWSASEYPYETDYNDHFETPLLAYQDTKPLIDWLIALLNNDGVESPNSGSHDEETTSTISHERIANSSGMNKKNRHNSPSPPRARESTESVPVAITTDVTLYDPYYCNGRTTVLLRELGFSNVFHEKRDFYADIEGGKVPEHGILITNPPYSDTHKKRCLDYCFEQLRGMSERNAETKTNCSRNKTPFLLLMPAYTASKQYYRDCLLGPQSQTSSSSEASSQQASEDVVYLVPSAPYHYEHPQNTGKEKSPFDSLWFCGIGKERVAAFKHFWESLPQTTANHHHQRLPALATSLAELQAMNVISFQNRPNPRNRGKKRKQMLTGSSGGEVVGVAARPYKSKIATVVADKTTTSSSSSVPESSSQSLGNEKKSKYRDPSSGKRTKKRF